MDALIAERFGMKVNINGTDCIVVSLIFWLNWGLLKETEKT